MLTSASSRRGLAMAALLSTLPVAALASASVDTAVAASTSVTGSALVSGTNVRSGPSTSSSVVARVSAGTSFTGTVSNGWMHITSGPYNGKYISVSTLKVSSQGQPSTGNVRAQTIYSSTNIRSSASTSAPIVGHVGSGTTITGTLSNGWLKISSPSSYSGKYVSVSVLGAVTAAGSSTPGGSAPKPGTPAPSKPSIYAVTSPFSCAANPTLPASKDANCAKAVQYVLNSWIIRTNTAGAQLTTVSGAFGSVTAQDLKVFQKANRLPQTGIVDSATWKALSAASAKSSKTPTASISGAPGDTHPAFPSAIKLTDGRLMLAFTSARQHMNNTTPSTLWKTYSSDGGYSWSTPQRIVLPNGMENTISGLGIATSGPLKGHPVLTTWSVGKDAAEKSTTVVHTYVTAANDLEGDSWGPLADINSDFIGSNTYSASPIVQVDDTNFQQAVYVFAGQATTSARTVGLTYDGSKFVIGASSVIAAVTAASPAASTSQPSASTTHGTTSVSSTNSVPTDGGFSEVGMIKLPDGRLFAMIRNDTTKSIASLWGSTSTDGGKTWSKPVKLFNGGGAPRLALISGGKLVVLYRHMNVPGNAGGAAWGQMSAVYRVSSDDGRTWGSEHSAGDPSHFEMAYGTPIANSDGTVTFVYSSETDGSHAGMVTNANVTVQK